MNQLFKISDVLKVAKKSIISFKEMKLNDLGESCEKFHYLTRNAKFAARGNVVSVDVAERCFKDENIYFSLLESGFVKFELSKAVGEVSMVCSLENPIEAGKKILEEDFEGFHIVNIDSVLGFHNHTAEHLSDGILILTADVGAVYLNKEFMTVYFNQNPRHTLANLVDGYSPSKNVLTIDCVSDGRLPINPLNIYAFYKKSLQSDVNKTTEGDSQDDSQDDGFEAFVNILTGAEEEVDSYSDDYDYDYDNDYDVDYDDEDDDDWYDEVMFNPETYVEISLSNERNDDGTKNLSFERIVGFSDERLSDVNNLLSLVKEVNIEKSIKGDLLLDGDDFNNSIILQKDLLGFGSLPTLDFLSLVADSIAYNITSNLILDAAKMKLILDDSHCVYDTAKDEQVKVEVGFTGDFSPENLDIRLRVKVVGSNNQADLIGNHFSITKLMQDSLLSTY